MPASSSTLLRPRRARRLWLPLLASAGALAGALSTLAGGAGLPSGAFGAAVPLTQQGLLVAHGAGWSARGPGNAAAGPVAAVSAAAGGTGASGHAALGTDASHTRLPANPPPYAPGGDDLLGAGTLAPRQGLAAAGALAGSSAPTLWLDRPTVRLGDAVVLHLAAGNGTTCWGTGALSGWAGAGPRIELRATVPGRHRLGVVCSGPGGAAEASVMLTVPLPVAPVAPSGAQTLATPRAQPPDLHQLGLQPLGPAEDHSPDLLARADFLQQGQASVWVMAAGVGPGAAPRAHVLARDAAGQWRDRSADLLDDDQRSVCPSAVQVRVADFNRDGRPDVWVVCGSGRQGLFLSQADDRYRRIETPFALQARQAEARDVDGDGWPDIVTLDLSGGEPRTLLLLGRGDGHFVAGPAEAWRLGLTGAADQRR